MFAIITRVYVPWFFVSSQQRIGVTDIKALDASQLSGLGQTVLQLHFIYKIAGESKTQREESGGVRGEGERERECAHAWEGGRERESEREKERGR